VPSRPPAGMASGTSGTGAVASDGASAQCKAIVEASGDGGLHHVEKRGDVEVARAVERRMANLEDLLDRLPAARQRDLGQDGIVNGTERLRNQCRTNQPRWIAGTERNQPPAPALRHRQRKEIAHEIDDILEIVGEADPLDRVGTHTRAISLGQTDWPADPGMKADIFGERRRYHALTDIGLDQHVRLAVLRDAAEDRPNIERRVRPGRLG
jgi:hypothetical protein